MNEIKRLCPLLGIATASAGGSPFVPCCGERCAWFDLANRQCTIQNIEPNE